MGLSPTARLEPPLDPDAPEARRWLTDELSKPEYRAAEPTAFDLFAQAVRDWFVGLFEGAGGLPAPVLALIAVLAIAVLVTVGLLVFGLPRLRRRSPATVALFDDGDIRDAVALRRAAEAAAASGDFALAVEERFRAVARSLVERELVRVHPGTTAHGIAREGARAFPEHAHELEAAAGEFDAVRYLGRPGTAERYRRVADLDEALSATRPAGEADELAAPVAGGGA